MNLERKVSQPVELGTGIPKAVVAALVTSLCLAFGFSVLAPSPASGARVFHYIAPNYAVDGYLSKPRSFSWSSPGVSGTARGVHWKHWGARKTVGRGRGRVCVTMGGGCRQKRLRFVATQHRGYVGPEAKAYIYCKVAVKGKLDPAHPHHRVSITLFRPGSVTCR